MHRARCQALSYQISELSGRGPLLLQGLQEHLQHVDITIRLLICHVDRRLAGVGKWLALWLWAVGAEDRAQRLPWRSRCSCRLHVAPSAGRKLTIASAVRVANAGGTPCGTRYRTYPLRIGEIQSDARASGHRGQCKGRARSERLPALALAV